MSARRAIPAVGQILSALGLQDLPRPIVTQLVRQHLAQLRLAERATPFDKILCDLRAALDHLARTRLQPLINGTGVILHTNFGRAPLSPAATRAVGAIALSYNNLEYDLETGGRGKRGAFLETSLALLCGSEAATVVNNCAAALVLIVRHFTRRKPEVIISRGELVQIGGGFRIGEIITASGARLREVGATNKTNLEDYADAIGSESGLILRVHQSNFFMGGFTAAPPNDELAKLAHARRVPFAVDLGSGALVPTEKFGLAEHEPTPDETLKVGADLVCFSGDKLFGGPQAGIIAGKSRLVAALKREPLFRALRCDKLVFAALEATADAHLRKAWDEIPVLTLLRTPVEQLRARAEILVRQRETAELGLRVVESEAEIGGGALPRSVIPSIALEFSSTTFSPNELAFRFRRAGIIGYIAKSAFRLDLRTIFPAQDDRLIEVLTQIVIPSECEGPRKRPVGPQRR
ncbi:MAG: L-seryl-tRNA(Sec) selenium transferase [Chthoniobacterales bacterium]|nr:L-seryl-tRNA(Sec) selenium transferase [Chthoniobacterales bacterium]